MPTLRSQYQHGRQEIQAGLGLSVSTPADFQPIIESQNQGMSNDEVSNQKPASPPTPPTPTCASASPAQNIINISSSSSDDDRSLASSNTSMHRQENGHGSARKKDAKSRKNSRNSNGSRKSRRSSGSVCEDLLNTATVHAPLPPQHALPLYTHSSQPQPTHLSQSGNLHYTSSQAYKLTAEQAIMQSLHMPPLPLLDGMGGVYSIPNLDQYPGYVDGGGDGRREQIGLDYHGYRPDQTKGEIEFPNTPAGLLAVLDQHGCFETQEGLRERDNIVQCLDLLTKQWGRTCGLKQGIDYTVLEKDQGIVLTYGSCKLEAADRDADMDLICVGPSYVSRDEFFTTLFCNLQKNEHITELRRLPDVFVPVVKFKFNKTEIDFTFSRLALPVPEKEEFLMNEVYKENLDDRCLRSLNGYRATCQILTLVPDVSVFQLSLRAIKLWGKQNGIYGNILGYLGGASCAILVARTCQEQAMRPDVEHCPKEVVFTFFSMFSQWKWPAPVYIRQVIDQPNSAWNPSVNPGDRDHAMPIITSSVPQMNSAVNINKPIQKYIQEKMSEGHQICQQIQSGLVGWEALFKPFPFYQEYDDFINITAECDKESSYWFGCIEAKLRYLKEKLEMCSRVESVRIWPKGFCKTVGQLFTKNWYIGIAISGSTLEKVVADDCRTFQERCFGDLRKNYGNSHMVLRSFSVHYSIVSRTDICKRLPLKELKMSSIERLVSYASVTQGSVRVPTPPVHTSTAVSGQQTNLHPGYIPPLSTTPGFPTTYTYATQTNSTPAIGGNMTPSYPNQTILPIYYMPQVFSHPADQLSPSSLLIQNPRPMSPRSTNSPLGFPSRTNSPNFHHRLNNSPTQFMFNDVGPMHPGMPVPGAGIPSTGFRSGSPSCMYRNFSPRNRTDVISVVGVRSINNNSKPPFSCVSVAEPEQAENRKQPSAFKDSYSDDDRLRSVSNSSDTVPPSFLYRSRINHQEAPPPFPFPAHTHHNQYNGGYAHPASPRPMPGMVPLLRADVTIPPPLPYTAPNSPAHQDSQQFTFSRPGPTKMFPRPHRSPRRSVSEVNDLASPRPFNLPHRIKNDIKVNISNNDDVFAR
jgi:poly(A) polymerase Pap1